MTPTPKLTPSQRRSKLDDLKPTDTFGERLRTAMHVSGLRVGELAHLSGLTQANLCHFMSGQREPTTKSLRRLLLAMPGCDARWLVVGRITEKGKSL